MRLPIDKMENSSLLIRGCQIYNLSPEISDILIQDGIIKEIRHEIKEEQIGKIIDASGMYLMPGIIDGHVHLILDGSPDVVNYVKNTGTDRLTEIAEKNAVTTLKNGITTVRDMGCTNFIVPRLRNRINHDRCQGPKIFAAGNMITKKSGHIKKIARETDTSPKDLKGAIAEQVEGGADFIKLIISGGLLTPNTEPTRTELDIDTINAAIAEADCAHLKTAAHVYSNEDTTAAVKAGAWTIEHAYFGLEDTFRSAASSSVFLVPTLKAAYSILENSDTLPKSVVANATIALDAAHRNLPKAIREGVVIVMGTDAGTPYNVHGDNASELEYLSEFGLSNEELIGTATVNASKMLGQSNTLGRIEVGYKADIILLDANPLDDIGAIRRRIKHVIKRGQIISNQN